MLEVAGLHAHYGRAHILADVSFSVGRGEVVALLGRNGAGKSTTLKSIMGLVPPTRGRITFDGRDIAGRPPYEIARLGLGYVPEDRRLFPELTVLENLEVGRRPAKDGPGPPWTPARLFRLFPNLAALGERPAGQISRRRAADAGDRPHAHGQSARAPARRALRGPRAGHRRAAGAHDPGAEGRGLTMLLAEQNLRFARVVAERALIIDRGTIRHSGAFAELAADERLRTAYLAV